ncbi:MAG: coiled coil domain-containing protein [Proteobacteria bacterium]|nr:coiled coil domain-containing protein [Pseudomonadota bacterium]
MATREEFEAKLKEQINGWNADLDKLEADAEAKIKYEKQIKELRQKAEEAQQNLTKIHDASDDAWEDLKQGAKTLWNMYENSFKKAKSEFKRGYREGLEE